MAQKYALVESPALKHAKLSIKPYVGKADNTGLKSYNMVIHERVWHTDTIPCRVDGLTKTYKTGLNEFAPEVQNLPKEKKEATIRNIRELVVKAENILAGNANISADDIYKKDAEGKQTAEFTTDFWSKVTKFKSVIADVFDNRGVRQLSYWDEFNIKLNNEGDILNEEDIKDLIKVAVIEAGGFSMIAPSYEVAAEDPKERYKFYLDKREDTSAIRTADRKLIARANAKLLAMSEKDANKMFYITKLVSNDSVFFKTGKNATPNDVLYEECSRYLEGLLFENKTLAAEKFIKLAESTLGEVKARCVLKDARYLNQVVFKENSLFDLKSGTILGKNEDEAVVFLMATANHNVFDPLYNFCNAEWNK